MAVVCKILLLVALAMTCSSITCASIDDLSIVLSPEVQTSLETRLNQLFEEMHTENWRLRHKQLEQELELRHLNDQVARASEQVLRLSRRMSTTPLERI